MRERFLTIAIAAIFVLLGVGLFVTQIIRYPYYARLARNNIIRIIPVSGPRGELFDRNGTPLVVNRISFDLALVYQEVHSIAKITKVLKDALGMSPSEVACALKKASSRPFAPVTVVEDIGKEKALILEEASVDTPGLVIETRSRRSYPYGNMGAHIFGYLGQISEDELGSLREYGYKARDLVGRAGLEKYYDAYLRGVDGGVQVEVDSRGRQTRVLGMREPQPGKDLRLSVDMRLQVACDRLLGSRSGVVAVMDPRTGELLALASHPSFDPNVFVEPERAASRMGLLKDRIGRPLTDRAISGLYPVGSVFKVVTSAAGLETRKIDAHTAFFCKGVYTLAKAQFKCWKADGHGSETITDALAHSCDVFFYSTGRLLGPDPIESYAKLFGYGRLTGVDLPDEVKGLAPGKAWKRAARHDNWYEGDTTNYSIGQGYLLATPLQVLNMMAVMANGGNMVAPHLVTRVGQSAVLRSTPKSLGLRRDTMKIIRQGLYDVVNGEDGTGKRSQADGINVAGKTGTAENPHGRTHAWFSGFAPFEDPRICLVVFLEHGGHGGVEPAEIASGIFAEAGELGYF